MVRVATDSKIKKPKFDISQVFAYRTISTYNFSVGVLLHQLSLLLIIRYIGSRFTLNNPWK